MAESTIKELLIENEIIPVKVTKPPIAVKRTRNVIDTSTTPIVVDTNNNKQEIIEKQLTINRSIKSRDVGEINKKTSPQDELEYALTGYSDSENNETTKRETSKANTPRFISNKMEGSFFTFLERMNTKEKIYPSIVLLLTLIIVIIVLFQRTVSAATKIIVVLVYFAEIIGTYLLFRK